MREQAKKMNVASLRSADAQNTSAECKLAKVCFNNIYDESINESYK
jgi:r-opsin